MSKNVWEFFFDSLRFELWFKFPKLALFLLIKESSIGKNIANIWKVFNDTFWPISNIRNIVHKKLLHLGL